MDKVIRTKSGIFVRNHKGYGLFAFVPFTGLVYAISEEYSKSTLKWLNQENVEVHPNIKMALGIGWKIKLEDCSFSGSNFLPEMESFENIESLNDILTINWFLSGECNFDCLYCYASDLMKGYSNPSLNEIKKIASNILSFNPLFVVLTGGEPLCSNYYQDAVRILSGKTGIIFDTNGYNLTNENIDFFKRENVVLRISLDSERPKIQSNQRKIKAGNKINDTYILNKIVNNISNCLDKDIPVIIQSVATNKNANELPELGDKLYKMGVKAWRIQRIQESKLNRVGFLSLMGKGKSLQNSYSSVDYNLKKVRDCQKNRWNNKIYVHVTMNHSHERNSVILVAPDGKFYTEKVNVTEKGIIDEKSPYRPSKKAILSRINTFGHFFRYINLK